METNVVVTDCTVAFGKEDPVGNREAFDCMADHGILHRVSFRTLSKFIYFKSTNDGLVEFLFKCEKKKIHYTSTKSWQSIYLGDEDCERMVEIFLKDVGDSIYIWPGAQFGFHENGISV